jgi:protein-S-isoprenylcysteine O-methyltransferase Ste14
MLYLLRHILSILVLPATVVVLIPLWIARRWNVAPVWPANWLDWTAAAVGLIAGTIGLTLFAASLRRFASEGRGTLAPWDPPRRLVVRGPYRYVRNPMISGVLFMLAGLALCLRSGPHGIWAALFAAINMLFIPLLEEPDLEQRFGDDYRAYCRAVPRFIPLVRPWDGSA